MKPGQMHEKELTDAIMELAALFGWERRVHFRPARTAHGWVTALQGKKGFPDLFLIRRPRRIAAELKVSTAVTQDQAEWLDEMEASGFECYVLYQRDLGGMQALLSGDEPRVTTWRSTPGVKIEKEKVG